MDNSRWSPSTGSNGAPSDPNSDEVLADAIRYWEQRRIVYNVILALIFLGWIVLTWPHFREASIGQGLLFLVIFTVMANLLYSTVYLFDLPLQHTPFKMGWRRWRAGLWLMGTLIAFVFTNYWIADEIYPYVR